ncbi:MAG: c-type cytochrome domain-containing protein [Bacteroidota bacterium]
MKYLVYGVVVLGITMVCFASCDKITKPDDSLDKIVFPESNISYNRHVQPLFNVACATSECHDTKTKADDLDLSYYSAAVNSKFGVIIPHDTSLSRLVWTIEGRPGSPRMPPQRSLNANHIRGLKQWILEGATDTIP